MELKIEYVPIDNIKPYDKNAKLHPQKQIEQIKKSIEEFGNCDPIGVWNGDIVEGHGRYEALKQLGYSDVPVIRLDHLTDEQRRAYALVHNKLTMNSPFDDGILSEELENILDIDMSMFDFGEVLHDIVGGEVVVDNYDEELPTEPKAKIGDIYQLGESRLMCGDSTNADNVKALLQNDKPDCIITDPPYCSGGYQEAGKSAGSIGTRSNDMIANDTLSTRGYMALIKGVLNRVPLIPFAYIFTDWRMWINLFDCVEASGYGVRSMIVWDKTTMGMGIGWRMQHELCMFAGKKAARFNPSLGRGNVIQAKRTGNKNHPTEKPVELIGEIMKVTDFANIIYDPFAGSGTTLIAAEQLGRKCLLMELDSRFVDVVINRWELFTGKKAQKIN